MRIIVETIVMALIVVVFMTWYCRSRRIDPNTITGEPTETALLTLATAREHGRAVSRNDHGRSCNRAG